MIFFETACAVPLTVSHPNTVGSNIPTVESAALAAFWVNVFVDFWPNIFMPKVLAASRVLLFFGLLLPSSANTEVEAATKALPANILAPNPNFPPDGIWTASFAIFSPSLKSAFLASRFSIFSETFACFALVASISTKPLLSVDKPKSLTSTPASLSAFVCTFPFWAFFFKSSSFISLSANCSSVILPDIAFSSFALLCLSIALTISDLVLNFSRLFGTIGLSLLKESLCLVPLSFTVLVFLSPLSSWLGSVEPSLVSLNLSAPILSSAKSDTVFVALFNPFQLPLIPLVTTPSGLTSFVILGLPFWLRTTPFSLTETSSPLLSNHLSFSW